MTPRKTAKHGKVILLDPEEMVSCCVSVIHCDGHEDLVFVVFIPCQPRKSPTTHHGLTPVPLYLAFVKDYVFNYPRLVV